MTSLGRRALAASLSAALMLLSAGPGCHEALASRLRAPARLGGAGVPVGVNAGPAVFGVPSSIPDGYAGPRDGGAPTVFLPRDPWAAGDLALPPYRAEGTLEPARAYAGPGQAEPARAAPREGAGAFAGLGTADARMREAPSHGARQGVLNRLFHGMRVAGGLDAAEPGAAPPFFLSRSGPEALRLAPAYRDPSGRRLTETTFVVADIEISSFYTQAEVSKIIELGAVKFRLKPDGSLEVLEVFSELIDPGLPIDERVTELTGITPEQLQGKPFIGEVLPRFLRFLGPDSVLIAHNADFDMSFLAHAAREQGLPLARHLVLDSKDIAKSVFPGLPSYSLQKLIWQWKLGGAEEHRGVSDAQYAGAVMVHAAKALAQRGGRGFGDLTVGDLKAHSDPVSFASALERMEPKAVEAERRRPLPEDPVRAALELDARNHKEGRPSMLRDLAYDLGVDYGELREALRQAHRRVAVSPADRILREIRQVPPDAVWFDYDGTLTDSGPDGLSLPVSREVVDRLIRLLRAGVPVAIVTARSLDAQPEGTSIPMTLWEPLISKIPEELRDGLFFSGRLGAEFVLFSKGQIQRESADWHAGEEARIAEAEAAAMTRAGVAPADLERIEQDGVNNLVFPARDVEKARAFGQALAEEFLARGLPYPVYYSKNWVYYSKFDKGLGGRLVLAAMRAKGFTVRPERLLIVGDQFAAPPGKPMGADAAAALAFPASRAVSVGDKTGDVLPPNVRRLGLLHARGSARVIDAVLDGWAARSSGPAPWDRPAARHAGAFLAGVAATLGVVYSSVAAALNSAALSLIGLPQILKNFRAKREATKDLSLGQSLIWFAATALLVAAGALKGEGPWFLAANAAGLLQSAVMLGQLIAYNRTPGDLRRTLVSAFAALGAIALAVGLLPAATAAAATFWTAMGLLLVINWPQIRLNYALYKAEGRIPSGLSPLYPILVWTGSAFGLIAATAASASFWALSSALAILTVSVVLGQLFAPRATNALIRPAVEAVLGFERWLARAWRRLR
ncbi:MAG: hypothetical protein HY554_11460 [Elusimicrobia bacterium]|nr:hypothetical protein [Elusimicrobiota bacterium]